MIADWASLLRCDFIPCPCSLGSSDKNQKAFLNVIAWISLSLPSDEEYTIAASARAATHSPFTLRSHISPTRHKYPNTELTHTRHRPALTTLQLHHASTRPQHIMPSPPLLTAFPQGDCTVKDVKHTHATHKPHTRHTIIYPPTHNNNRLKGDTTTHTFV